jgi:iron-sulfur cluster repair protein YtfE (RIC family)
MSDSTDRRTDVEVSGSAAQPETRRRISEAFCSDHERLARLEVEAFVARAAGDTATAAVWYQDFSSGLRSHIALEEELLFPLFEKRAGFFPGSRSTEEMRTEHVEILRLLVEILRTIGDPAKLPDQARAAFHEILEEHHRKEEGMLYPALDQILTPEEGDSLIARIQTQADL